MLHLSDQISVKEGKGDDGFLTVKVQISKVKGANVVYSYTYREKDVWQRRATTITD